MARAMKQRSWTYTALAVLAIGAWGSLFDSATASTDTLALSASIEQQAAAQAVRSLTARFLRDYRGAGPNDQPTQVIEPHGLTWRSLTYRAASKVGFPTGQYSVEGFFQGGVGPAHVVGLHIHETPTHDGRSTDLNDVYSFLFDKGHGGNWTISTTYLYPIAGHHQYWFNSYVFQTGVLPKLLVYPLTPSALSALDGQAAHVLSKAEHHQAVDYEQNLHPGIDCTTESSGKVQCEEAPAG
jgi:hypothetical protein